MTAATDSTADGVRTACPPRPFSDFAWTPANASEATLLPVSGDPR